MNGDHETTGPTVAIIGCGPGGMFFLHVLEKRRRELIEMGDAQGMLAALPIPTCFERASGPGGVWRAERSFESDEEHGRQENGNVSNGDCNMDKKNSSSLNMYEALWTNGSKENIEFYDYTYQEHFQRRLPVFMPRKAILEYTLARVTRNCPDIFEKHVKFNTTVVHVEYKESIQKFEVTTQSAGSITKGLYDKCIWAAGDNGKPIMPKKLVSALDNFSGTVLHSSDASMLDQHVNNKRVVLIGGNYSAEDLALMAIKLNVTKIYIAFRDKDAYITKTTRWPQNKVELLTSQLPFQTEGNSLWFGKVKWDTDKREYIKEKDTIVLDDVDTVILCTGYEENYSMLAKNLRPPKRETDLDDYSVPSDWVMSPNHLTDELGNIPVGKIIAQDGSVRPGLYRGVLMSNPNMMFCEGGGEEPLLEMDICCHKLFAYMTGMTPLPLTVEEMARQNHEQFLRELDDLSHRYYIDDNYRRAVDKLDSPTHWMSNTKDPRNDEIDERYYLISWLRTSLYAKDGHYPVDIGSYEKCELSDIGKRYYENSVSDDGLRGLPDFKEGEGEWRTFRDYNEEHCRGFVSVFTGANPVPLKSRWIDIDENNENVEC